MGLLREFTDQIVIRVQEKVKELETTSIKRGKLMCTCYPGGDRWSLTAFWPILAVAILRLRFGIAGWG